MLHPINRRVVAVINPTIHAGGERQGHEPDGIAPAPAGEPAGQGIVAGRVGEFHAVLLMCYDSANGGYMSAPNIDTPVGELTIGQFQELLTDAMNRAGEVLKSAVDYALEKSREPRVLPFDDPDFSPELNDSINQAHAEEDARRTHGDEVVAVN